MAERPDANRGRPAVRRPVGAWPRALRAFGKHALRLRSSARPPGARGLEFRPGRPMLSSCQSTNFIVANASATAKSWFARATGRGRGVRTAVRRSCPKNSRYSRPPAGAAGKKGTPAEPGTEGAAAAAVVAGLIGIDNAAPRGTVWRPAGLRFDQAAGGAILSLHRRGSSSGSPRSNPGDAAAVRQTWRRRWPQPGLWPRWRARSGHPGAYRR